MLKLGIVGNKEMAASLADSTKKFELIGYYDPIDDGNSSLMENDYTYYKDFLGRVDAILLLNNDNLEMMQYVDLAIRRSKHVLVDGMFLFDLPAMTKLKSMNTEAGATFQVANMLRTSPTMVTASQYLKSVRYIRSLRRIPRQECTVDFLLKNYIVQELEMITYVINSDIKRIVPNLMNVFGNSPEMFSLHLEFYNGSQAEIKIELWEGKDKHTMAFYQQDKIVQTNLDHEEVHITKCVKDPTPQLLLNLNHSDEDAKESSEMPSKTKRPVMRFDQLKKELLNFEENAINGFSPILGIDEAHKTCKIIAKIEGILEKNYVY
jgi:predicted transcriptional regulator